jgi:hypothetical protein
MIWYHDLFLEVEISSNIKPWIVPPASSCCFNFGSRAATQYTGCIIQTIRPRSHCTVAVMMLRSAHRTVCILYVWQNRGKTNEHILNVPRDAFSRSKNVRKGTKKQYGIERTLLASPGERVFGMRMCYAFRLRLFRRVYLVGSVRPTRIRIRTMKKGWRNHRCLLQLL